MAWRTAIALDEYRAAINARFPNRSKASDGTIGDVAHAGQGQGSDHNPWVVRNGIGVVRAFDLTHDPRNGVDCEKLSDYLFDMGKAGDPRLRNGGYLIFNNWITNADWGAWRRYNGSNPHTSHMHVSFSADFFDNRGDWSRALGPAAPKPPVGGSMNIEQEIRNQLTGSAELGKYPGWKQLGNRTVVDALAVIGAKLNIEGFDPKAGK
ncbi:hypothetical protein 7S6_4 [uncultured Caudovirales phage]|uniref:Uncharacterized protein n=1 Tax=uncultured Caudovirales phage TaxID=2100421 RepID=A0A2H4JEY3_9CAUD|nr:hypothetical protein 7S6_4 [uncultured Caudovirales phage]